LETLKHQVLQNKAKRRSNFYSIGLADGQVAKGDCAAVQYSGAGGRDPLFLAEQYLPYLEEEIKPLLLKMDVNEFKANAELIDNLKKGDKKIHTALRYGITQALLHATALTNKVSMAEVIRKEYKITNKVYKRVDIFSQTGDHRHEHADKMILKKLISYRMVYLTMLVKLVVKESYYWNT